MRDGYSGIAYRDNSPGGLMSALERGLDLFSDRDAVRTMQIQAVREIKDKYTWSKVMKRYVELYEKAMYGQVIDRRL